MIATYSPSNTNNGRGIARHLNINPIIILWTTYFAFSFLRVLLYNLIKEPSVLHDEAIYKWMAYNLHTTGELYSNKFFPIYPNFLYQLLISPCYLFKDNLIWIKIVNSLLLHSMLFPSFLMMKEFIGARKASLMTPLILLLPIYNIGSHIMAEALFFPLFLWVTYFYFKWNTETSTPYAIATGITLALLFLTKPHALTTILLFSLTQLVLLFMDIRNGGKWKKTLILTTVASLLFVIITLIGNYLIYKQWSISYLTVKDSIYYDPANTVQFLSSALFQQLMSKPFYQLLVGHLAPLLLFYSFPIIVSLYALFQFIQAKEKKKVWFLIIGWGQFIASFLLAIKYSVEINHLNRVHARYYIMALPFFIIACACFWQSIQWTKRKRIVVGLVGLFTIIGNIIFLLYSNYIYLGGSLADSPDTTWYRFFHQQRVINIVYICLLVCLGLLALYYSLHRHIKITPYWIFLCLLLIIANTGHVKALKLTEKKLSPQRAPRETIHYIVQNSHIPWNKIAIIWPDRYSHTNYYFWYPQTEAMHFILKPRIHLTNDMLPTGINTIIITDHNYYYDEFVAETDTVEKYSPGHITVITKIEAKQVQLSPAPTSLPLATTTQGYPDYSKKIINTRPNR